MEYASDLLAGMVAFITGGTSGINLGIAEAFANHGASVVAVGRDEARGARAVEYLRETTGSEARYYQADVRDFEALDRALLETHAALGPIDIVIAGAAGNFRATADALSSNAFRTVVDIDLNGTFNTFRAAHQYVVRPGASMIAITAPQGTHPMPMQAHACAAKAGVNMLVQCLALEWGTEGTRVNAISPGPIAGTEGASERLVSVDRREALLQSLPLGRFGEREEIARAALFLASGLASYTTGHVLDCEGGLLLGDASAVVP